MKIKPCNFGRKIAASCSSCSSGPWLTPCWCIPSTAKHVRATIPWQRSRRPKRVPPARGSPPFRASISPLSNLWNRLSSKSKSSKLVPSRRRLRSLDGWPAGPLPPDPFIVCRRWPAQTTSRRSEIRPASCSLQLRHSTTRLFFVPSLSAAIPTTVPP